MGDFSQNGIVSTLHDFKTKSTEQIEKELLDFSKERKMELILPCLYSCLLYTSPSPRDATLSRMPSSA